MDLGSQAAICSLLLLASLSELLTTHGVLKAQAQERHVASKQGQHIVYDHLMASSEFKTFLIRNQVVNYSSGHMITRCKRVSVSGCSDVGFGGGPASGHTLDSGQSTPPRKTGEMTAGLGG